jgi:hypothetical protein
LIIREAGSLVAGAANGVLSALSRDQLHAWPGNFALAKFSSSSLPRLLSPFQRPVPPGIFHGRQGYERFTPRASNGSCMLPIVFTNTLPYAAGIASHRKHCTLTRTLPMGSVRTNGRSPRVARACLPFGWVGTCASPSREIPRRRSAMRLTGILTEICRCCWSFPTRVRWAHPGTTGVLLLSTHCEGICE